MQQKVSIATDQTSMCGAWGDGGLVNQSHEFVGWACWEETVPMNHVASVNGGIVGKHSLAAHVLHKSQSIVQQFHDCGYLIKHIGLFTDPVMGPLESSRAVVFGAALVRIEGKPVGFAVFSAPSTPMLTCGKIPLPVGASDDSPLNSVVVGMDPEWDHQCGWDHIGLLTLRAKVANAVGAIGTVVGLVVAVLSPIATLGEAVKDILKEGAGVGFKLGSQVGRDVSGRGDIGRRYQERMQRRRAAGETNFQSARRAERLRGTGEGLVEPSFGPASEMWTGPASDYLFGTGSQEPEY